MKYIQDLTEGETVVEHYYCKQRQNLKSRAGKTYLSLKLQDKTGVIDGKVWTLNNDIQGFHENDFIKVAGTVLFYQNDLQLNINKIRKSLEGEYDPMDYVPCTPYSIESLWAQLNSMIDSVGQEHLLRLLKNIFSDEKTADAFKSCSAARTMHHSYLGGLLEHTVSVAAVCDFLASRYKTANRDILITAALLHDLGKIYELSPFPSNSYTDDGELLGHIVMTSELIEAGCAQINDFPHGLKSLLKHCILSHHGEYEFGSPKLPKIIEAVILHYADDLDAKTNAFEMAVAGDNAQAQGDWVGFSKMFNGNLRKTVF